MATATTEVRSLHRRDGGGCCCTVHPSSNWPPIAFSLIATLLSSAVADERAALNFSTSIHAPHHGPGALLAIFPGVFITTRTDGDGPSAVVASMGRLLSRHHDISDPRLSGDLRASASYEMPTIARRLRYKHTLGSAVHCTPRQRLSYCANLSHFFRRFLRA